LEFISSPFFFAPAARPRLQGAFFSDISNATTFLQCKVGTNLAWSLPEFTIGTILARSSGWQDLEEKFFLFFYRKPLDRFAVLWYTLDTVKERGKQK